MKIFTLLFLFCALTLNAALERFAFTNTVGQPDTNWFRVFPLDSTRPVLADGTVVTAGLPIRIVPKADGKATNYFQIGSYYVTNTTGSAYVFRVFDSSQAEYNSALPPSRLSGLGTFATIIYGTNPPPTYNQITNGLGFVPVTLSQVTNVATNADFTLSNGLYTIAVALMAASSNHFGLLSTNGTNFSLAIGLADTNFTKAVGLALTNLVGLMSTNSTNFAVSTSNALYTIFTNIITTNNLTAQYPIVISGGNVSISDIFGADGALNGWLNAGSQRITNLNGLGFGSSGRFRVDSTSSNSVVLTDGSGGYWGRLLAGSTNNATDPAYTFYDDTLSGMYLRRYLAGFLQPITGIGFSYGGTELFWGSNLGLTNNVPWNGDFSGATNINASSLSSGTIPDARLAVTIARTANVGLLSTNATNFSLLLAGYGTNFTLSTSNLLRSYTLSVGTLISNYATAQAQFYSGTVGTNATNNILLYGGYQTNFVLSTSNLLRSLIYSVGTLQSNYALAQAQFYSATVATNATNFTISNGLLLTNYAKAMGLVITNFIYAQGVLESNYAVAQSQHYANTVATNLTNFAKAVGLALTNYAQPTNYQLTTLSTNNGRSVTNIHGTNIQAGTINSNKLDAATLALLGSGGSSSGIGGDSISLVGTNNSIESTNSGLVSIVAAGSGNHLTNGLRDFIIGGGTNYIDATGTLKTRDSGILGGRNQGITNSLRSMIIGGDQNTIVHTQLVSDVTVLQDDNLIAGGELNNIFGWVNNSTIIGGGSNVIRSNAAGGQTFFSYALGNNSTVTNTRAWVYSDGASVTSKVDSSIVFYAMNGFGINTNAPGTNALKVLGNVDATSFSGNGAGITGISATATNAMGNNNGISTNALLYNRTSPTPAPALTLTNQTAASYDYGSIDFYPNGTGWHFRRSVSGDASVDWMKVNKGNVLFPLPTTVTALTNLDYFYGNFMYRGSGSGGDYDGLRVTSDGTILSLQNWGDSATNSFLTVESTGVTFNRNVFADATHSFYGNGVGLTNLNVQPTNSPTDGYVISATGAKAKWVAQSGGGSSIGWTTNTGTASSIAGTNDTYVIGQASGGGSFALTNAVGSIVQGIVEDAGSKIEINGEGSQAVGYASTGGKIRGLGNGSIAYGIAVDHGEILASYDGSWAWGWVQDYESQVYSSYAGCTAFGFAQQGGKIHAGGIGAFATGWATDTNSTITTSGSGAMASGSVIATGTILASGSGAHAFGYSGKNDGSATSDTLSHIIASGIGSMAMGMANDGQVDSTGTTIQAVGNGAFAGGGGNVAAKGNFDFAFGSNLSTDSANGGDPIDGHGSEVHGSGYTNTVNQSFSVGWGAKMFEVGTTGTTNSGTLVSAGFANNDVSITVQSAAGFTNDGNYTLVVSIDATVTGNYVKYLGPGTTPFKTNSIIVGGEEVILPMNGAIQVLSGTGVAIRSHRL